MSGGPTGQLTLPLGHRAALDRADFIVGDANRDAVAWIDRWPAWPMSGLVIAGPPASGKSHLAEVWRQRSAAARAAGDALARAAVPVLAAAGAVVVEDFDQAAEAGRADERALLHLVNLLRERGGSLLLTARTAPARWQVALPDLRSRLAALPVAMLAPPDDAVLHAVIVKLFSDRQLRVEPDVVRFLASRIDRSIAAAAAAVAALDAAALADARAVTVPLVRQVLSAASK